MPVRKEVYGSEVISLSYDFEKKIGLLRIAEGSQPDARLTSVFETIDSDVEHVEVLSGGNPNTLYVKVNGKWDMRSAE